MIRVIDHLMGTLDVLEKQARDFPKEVALPVAREMAVIADRNVPRRTGRLARSQEIGLSERGAYLRYGRRGAGYASVVHKRKPWLLDATEAVGADSTVNRFVNQKV